MLAGILVGLACLTRPSALAMTPLLLAPLFDRRYPVRARAHLAGSAVLGLVLGLAPWVIRNAVVYRDFILVSDVGGLNVYLGNDDAMRQFFDVRTREEYELWAAETDRETRGRIAQLQARGSHDARRGQPGTGRRDTLRRDAHPGAHVRLLLLKSWDWLRPYPNPLFWPRLFVVAVGLFYGVLYVLAAVGLARAPRRGVSLFALGVLVLSMGAHVASVVSWRYRVPYWDPILLLYAVFAVVRPR